jgi:DNA-binding LacI/PurR family transcriptional regulator
MSELRDILAEMGRDLAAEFGLAVVDDSQASERLNLPAVKAIQSAEAIGASSAECLISRIATPKQPPRRLQLPAKFVDPPKA